MCNNTYVRKTEVSFVLHKTLGGKILIITEATTVDDISLNQPSFYQYLYHHKLKNVKINLYQRCIEGVVSIIHEYIYICEN